MIKVKPGKRTKKQKYYAEKRSAEKTYNKQPYIDSGGYPCIYLELRGYVRVHRIVAEKALGRKLKIDEEVHHIDGDKMNASPGNLLICSSRYHKELHQRCKTRYGTWHLPSHYKRKVTWHSSS
jgi:hypothetical protein